MNLWTVSTSLTHQTESGTRKAGHAVPVLQVLHKTIIISAVKLTLLKLADSLSDCYHVPSLWQTRNTCTLYNNNFVSGSHGGGDHDPRRVEGGHPPSTALWPCWAHPVCPSPTSQTLLRVWRPWWLN